MPTNLCGRSTNIRFAAYHEAAHAVACAALGLPLEDTGMHVDRSGLGIIFSFHRKPGNPSNTAADITCREKSIVMIKAGYVASLKVNPGSPPWLAKQGRCEEKQLLDETYPVGSEAWFQADSKLNDESQRLVSQHWNAIQALAETLLARTETRQPLSLAPRWTSSETHEQCLSGSEIAAILSNFNLKAIVQSRGAPSRP